MVSTTTAHPEVTPDGEADLEAWRELLGRDRGDEQRAIIDRAIDIAVQAHAGQTRASGEPYHHHVLAVAAILAELNMDHETIAAAILHDVVEDTPITLGELREMFGREIAVLVDGVTKMDIIQAFPTQGIATPQEHAHAESLRKMLLAMAEDVRVVLIKLADRLHNMRTLASLPEPKQKRIARETMDLFAPLANRLGIWQIKWELEDLAFRYLRPDQYKQIAQALAERRVDREAYIDRFVDDLCTELKRHNIEAEVKGRAKHIYGIWKKMQRKNFGFHQIYDQRAVRIHVEEIPQCYAALGVVHTLWQYLPGEFDDYIATPKENNYRSIHTAVIGPEGKTVEVQIRTYTMHRQAEYGVAAHWRYKEGTQSDAGFDSKIAWLRQVLEWKDEVAEASEFVDQFKSEMFDDRVYVFTPMGNVIDLPRGSTPLDFAYQIHTEVGHRCRGAKVNGHIVPLTYNLRTGEHVEVLAVKRGGPSRDWLNPHLNYVATNRARTRIQHWFRVQDYAHNVAEGRTRLERELKRLGLVDVNLEKVAKRFKFDKLDDFFAAMAVGDLKPLRVINALQDLWPPRPEAPVSGTRRRRATEQTPADVTVRGVGDLLTRMAKCCKPLPGDPIVGYITRGQGVTVHRRDCHNALNYVSASPERLVEVDWGERESGAYPVDVYIEAYDRQGLLRDITTLLANENINVLGINSLSDPEHHTAAMVISLEVGDISTLSKILAKINQLRNVTEVRRKI